MHDACKIRIKEHWQRCSKLDTTEALQDTWVVTQNWIKVNRDAIVTCYKFYLSKINPGDPAIHQTDKQAHPVDMKSNLIFWAKLEVEHLIPKCLKFSKKEWN